MTWFNAFHATEAGAWHLTPDAPKEHKRKIKSNMKKERGSDFHASSDVSNDFVLYLQSSRVVGICRAIGYCILVSQSTFSLYTLGNV